jgi:hypothetical protein
MTCEQTWIPAAVGRAATQALVKGGEQWQIP